jgi:hypothetical protein
MMIEMTESEWSAKYRPIKNHLVKDDTTSFETYGEQVDFVASQDNQNVWTELDGDEGVYIVAGYHYASRIQYYVTELPWESDDIFVTVCKFVDCECMDDEGEGKQDCETCGGDGTYTEWSMD